MKNATKHHAILLVLYAYPQDKKNVINNIFGVRHMYTDTVSVNFPNGEKFSWYVV